jgi:hypothetical protein
MPALSDVPAASVLPAGARKPSLLFTNFEISTEEEKQE